MPVDEPGRYLYRGTTDGVSVEGYGVLALGPGESRSGAFHLDVGPLDRS